MYVSSPCRSRGSLILVCERDAVSYANRMAQFLAPHGERHNIPGSLILLTSMRIGSTFDRVAQLLVSRESDRVYILHRSLAYLTNVTSIRLSTDWLCYWLSDNIRYAHFTHGSLLPPFDERFGLSVDRVLQSPVKR